MKINIRVLLCIAVLSFGRAFAQEQAGSPARSNPPSAPPLGGFQQRMQQVIAAAQPASKAELTKFNLDFHGGTPKDLVVAIEAALGRNINVIVPEDLANTKLPALKMEHVDVSELFTAIARASRKTEVQRTSFGNYSQTETAYGFSTDGAPSDDAIWYFFWSRPVTPPAPEPEKICRFYPLGPYLDAGMKVDDITTAIQTGWKMLGETSTPSISFHKDTKLLIAVGDPKKLEMIDDVLKALGKQMPPDPNDPMVLLRAAKAGLNLPPAGKPANKPQDNK